MALKISHNGYGSLSILMHWLMLVLVAAAYAAQDLNFVFPKHSPGRAAMDAWHYMLGLLVFSLVWVRLAARVLGPTGVIEPQPPRWQLVGARLMYLTLYAMMLALPLLGWLTLSARGDPVPFFGMHWPALAGKSEELARRLKDIHETVADAGYFLIGLHTLAALYHHHVRHDNALLLMLPRRNR
jgi:cytochrome b561